MPKTSRKSRSQKSIPVESDDEQDKSVDSGLLHKQSGFHFTSSNSKQNASFAPPVVQSGVKSPKIVVRNDSTIGPHHSANELFQSRGLNAQDRLSHVVTVANSKVELERPLFIKLSATAWIAIKPLLLTYWRNHDSLPLIDLCDLSILPSIKSSFSTMGRSLMTNRPYSSQETCGALDEHFGIETSHLPDVPTVLASCGMAEGVGYCADHVHAYI